MARATSILIVRFEAKKPPHGAFINAWIKTTDSVDAVICARRAIENAGWTCVAVDEVSPVRADNEGRAYYGQALIDDEVLVIHQYPLDAPEDD